MHLLFHLRAQVWDSVQWQIVCKNSKTNPKPPLHLLVLVITTIYERGPVFAKMKQVEGRPQCKSRSLTRRPPTPSPKITSISGTKNKPKTGPLLPACLGHDNPLYVLFMKRSRDSKAGIETLRGWPDRDHASDAKRVARE